MNAFDQIVSTATYRLPKRQKVVKCYASEISKLPMTSQSQIKIQPNIIAPPTQSIDMPKETVPDDRELKDTHQDKVAKTLFCGIDLGGEANRPLTCMITGYTDSDEKNKRIIQNAHIIPKCITNDPFLIHNSQNMIAILPHIHALWDTFCFQIDPNNGQLIWDKRFTQQKIKQLGIPINARIDNKWLTPARKHFLMLRQNSIPDTDSYETMVALIEKQNKKICQDVQNSNDL